MSDYLALDWENHQVSGLEAAVTRQGTVVRKAFVLTWPEEINPERDTEQAAQWLKKQLGQAGIATRSVLVSLPRESVVVRRLTVPNAPDDELPALVQMQAATKSSTPLDQLELDFLPLPLSSPEAGRDVLMCTMAKKRTSKLRALLEAAGLELECLGISSVATAELVAREEKARKIDPAETSLIIARHGHRVEISILQQQQVVFSHSTQIHADDEHLRGNESSIVAEVQRSMVSLHPQSGRLKVDRAWLVGEVEEFVELAAAVESRLKCETVTLNPESFRGLTNQAGDWPKPIGAFAGPAGLLLARHDSIVGAIDFQNPRKQRPRRDIKKIRMITGAVAAAVLLIVAIGYRYWKVGSLRDEITQKREQIEDLKKVVKLGEPTMKSAGLVGEWDQKAMKELAQIGQLYSAMPGTDLMYLVKYNLLPGSRTSAGVIQAEGRAKAEADVRELFGKLADRGIKVKPSKTQQSTDSDYPVQFTLDLELPLPQSPQIAVASAPRS